MRPTASKYHPQVAAQQAAGVSHADLLAARTLVAGGDDAGATRAYLALLARDPVHFQCLTELAGLAFAGGFRSAARTAYEQAVLHHPDEPLGRVNLANSLSASGESPAARLQLLAALELDPDFAPAHQGLALILAEDGDFARADIHRDKGFRGHAVARRPFRGTGTAASVLLLVSARGGNIPTDLWLTDRRYDVTAVYAEYFDPSASLPTHDLVFNAIGDADLCPDALTEAVKICARTSKPVLNPPERVIPTGRAETARRLASISGARTPGVRAATSTAIRAMDGVTFPVLIRRPGYHTGKHFHMVDTRSDLDTTLDAFDPIGSGDLLLIDYMDARGPDGMARKYRVMFIGGQLYPLHLAVSTDWKVHYFTSAMADDAAFRAEEQRFLDDPRSVIGVVGMAALAEIAERLDLDYAGIDFGLASNGTILVFEVNATMVLIPPGADPVWDYRRPAIGRAFDAVTAMFERRLGATSSNRLPESAPPQHDPA